MSGEIRAESTAAKASNGDSDLQGAAEISSSAVVIIDDEPPEYDESTEAADVGCVIAHGGFTEIGGPELDDVTDDWQSQIDGGPPDVEELELDDDDDQGDDKGGS